MKTYLEIPFQDQLKAKGLGAKFDMSRKQWFCPDGVDLALFKEWLPEELQSWFKNTAGRVTSRKTSRRTGSRQ